MGVSGSGKSTLGQALAQELGWDFLDGDDFHSAENIAKMTAGIPLSDIDRTPWLAALNRQFLSALAAGRHPILACSALKEKYRLQLLYQANNIAIVHLRGSYDLIWSRMSARQGHYMKPEMLHSQLDTLEEPTDALILDAAMTIREMLDTILENYPVLRSSKE